MSAALEGSPPELATAFAFLRWLDERASTRTESFRYGTAYFHERLPRVWDRNFLRVDADPRELDFDVLLAEVARLQGGAGLEHRKLLFEDAAAGKEAAALLQADGWSLDREVVMAHRGDVPDVVGTDDVAEVDTLALRPAREQTMRADPRIMGEESIEQLLETDLVLDRAGAGRSIAALHAGDVVSCCRIYSDGETAQIDEVATLPQFQHAGYATAVLSKAVHLAADHGVTFLLALADDWPRQWYARMGFAPIGLRYGLTQAAASSGRRPAQGRSSSI